MEIVYDDVNNNTIEDDVEDKRRISLIKKRQAFNNEIIINKYLD